MIEKDIILHVVRKILQCTQFHLPNPVVYYNQEQKS